MINNPYIYFLAVVLLKDPSSWCQLIVNDGRDVHDGDVTIHPKQTIEGQLPPATPVHDYCVVPRLHCDCTVTRRFNSGTASLEHGVHLGEHPDILHTCYLTFDLHRINIGPGNLFRPGVICNKIVAHAYQ